MTRRTRPFVVSILAVFGWLLTATEAQAAVAYNFVTDQTNYSLLPNGTAVAQVFLRETLTAGSTSTLAAENGLFSAVARATRTTSPTAPATITAAARDTTNFNDFNDSSVQAGGAQADVGGTRSLGSANGSAIIVDSSTVRRVAVGTLTIQAGLIPLQTTTFTLSDRTGTVDTLTWTNGTPLDSQIAASTFTVTVIPEPAAALGLFGAFGLFLVRRQPPRR